MSMKRSSDFIIHLSFLPGLDEEINYLSHTLAKIEHLLKATQVFIIPQPNFFHVNDSEILWLCGKIKFPALSISLSHYFSVPWLTQDQLCVSFQCLSNSKFLKFVELFSTIIWYIFWNALMSHIFFLPLFSKLLICSNKLFYISHCMHVKLCDKYVQVQLHFKLGQCSVD